MPAWFDRVLGAVGLQRQGKGGRNAYLPSYFSRFSNEWVMQTSSVDKDLWLSLKGLRGMSRALARESEIAKRFFAMVRTHIVGPYGFGFQARFKKPRGGMDDDLNTKIENLFAAWSMPGNCDVTGALSFTGLCQLVIEAVAKDGEVLIRLVRDAALPYGLQLQVIEADYLNESRNEELRNGESIRMGVKLDTWGKPLGYYLRQFNPGDYRFGDNLSTDDVFVPAGEIIHLYERVRPHQTRGLPWMHAVMFALDQLKGYKEAELVACRAAACKGGFYKPAEGSDYGAGLGRDEQGRTVQELEPGQLEVLPPGMDFIPYSPQHPTNNFSAFVVQILHGVASGLNVSYSSLTGDLSQVNYSSTRAGRLEEVDGWKTRQNWFIESFLTPIYLEWLRMAALKGFVDFSALQGNPAVTASFTPRRWEWVDPLKDGEANLLAIQTGQKSISALIREAGNDPDTVIQELSDDVQKLKEAGLEAVATFIYAGQKGQKQNQGDTQNGS